MYDFNAIANEATRENILKLVREEDLWRFYLRHDYTLGRTFKSPLRSEDDPSFSIFWASRMGKLMFKDHGRGLRGDIFDFVGILYSLDRIGTCNRINSDLNLGLVNKDHTGLLLPSNSQVSVVPKVIVKKQGKALYEAQMRPPVQSDIEYWGQYGITRPTLRMYKVQCVNVLYCNGVCVYTYQPNDPCYEYLFPSGNVKYYRPYAKKTDKFRGNIDNNIDIQGYIQCRLDEWYEGKMMVFTKSMKDIMLLREYDIDSVAIHGENHKFNSDFIRHIKKRYPKVVSLYDRDKSGVCGARSLWKEYQIPALFIKEAKDLTDLYKKDRMKADEFIVKLRR